MINENLKYYKDRHDSAELQWKYSKSETKDEYYQIMCESNESLKRWQKLKEYLEKENKLSQDCVESSKNGYSYPDGYIDELKGQIKLTNELLGE